MVQWKPRCVRKTQKIMEQIILFFLHVVKSADFIGAGDHVGLIVFKFAAPPVRCGVDIDVPEFIKKLVVLV